MFVRQPVRIECQVGRTPRARCPHDPPELTCPDPPEPTLNLPIDSRACPDPLAAARTGNTGLKWPRKMDGRAFETIPLRCWAFGSPCGYPMRWRLGAFHLSNFQILIRGCRCRFVGGREGGRCVGTFAIVASRARSGTRAQPHTACERGVPSRCAEGPAAGTATSDAPAARQASGRPRGLSSFPRRARDARGEGAACR